MTEIDEAIKSSNLVRQDMQNGVVNEATVLDRILANQVLIMEWIQRHEM